MWRLSLFVLCLLTTIGGVDARIHHRLFIHSHRNHLNQHRRVPVVPRSPVDIIEVQTAAGIPIRVAAHLSEAFQGFIREIVDNGYVPRSIGCWAPYGTHVAFSRHYAGAACDFDQTGWGKTARAMYHVTSIAHKYGLRDGCEFKRPDCGHIDDGLGGRYYASHHPRNQKVVTDAAPRTTVEWQE